jgi:hypothetical protein
MFGQGIENGRMMGGDSSIYFGDGVGGMPRVLAREAETTRGA